MNPNPNDEKSPYQHSFFLETFEERITQLHKLMGMYYTFSIQTNAKDFRIV